MNFFRPRSWLVRHNAALSRSARQEQMADVFAAHAAMFYGEPVDPEVSARLAAAAGEVETPVVEAETAIEPVVETVSEPVSEPVAEAAPQKAHKAPKTKAQ